MAKVVLQDVSRVFPGGVVAIRHFDLEVNDQELLVLLGPSGCGKTTTLRMIAGLDEPTEGVIRIGDRKVNGMAPHRRDVAMVFQNDVLYGHLSVLGNMAFGLRLRCGPGLPRRVWNRITRPAEARRLARQRQEIPQDVRSTANVLGIEPLLDRLPRSLSGGQRQRAALGRAMVRRPAVFLLDEPLAALDVKLRTQMRQELAALHRRLAATMIFVTHDQQEALTLGQRIAVIDKGRIQQIGTPMEVYDRPRNRFVAAFIGSPGMNLIDGALEENEGELTFRGGGVTVALKGAMAAQLRKQETRSVVFGVRPEDVSVRTCEESHGGGGAARGCVSFVEALGDSSVLHLEIAGTGSDAKKSANTLLGRVAARTALRPGDAVQVDMAMDRVHVFDAQSGANLGLACRS